MLCKLLSALACEQDAEQARSMSAEAVKMLSRAYIADKTNCMVLNHLANHYFWTWLKAPTLVSVSPNFPPQRLT